MIKNENLKKLFPTIFFGSLATFAVMAINNPGYDFRGYYGAAMLILRGGNPYEYAQLAPLLEEISGFQGNNPYFYPPWYCLAFIPFTMFPFRVAQILWIGVNLTLFYISLEWLWEVIDWKIEPWFRWVVFIFANILFGYNALISENSGFVLLFALALTLRSLKNNQATLAGLGFILLATKPQATFITIITLGVWVLRKKATVIIWTAIWFLGIMVTTTFAFPRWWDFDKYNFGLGIGYGQDGAGVIVGRRVAATVYDWSQYFLHVQGWIWGVVIIMAFALALYLIFTTWRNHYDPVYIAAAGTLATLLITPYALQYDFAPLTLPFFLIAQNLPKLERSKVLIILSIFLAIIIIQFYAKWQFQVYWIVLCITVAFLLATSKVLSTKQHQTREKSTQK